MPNAGFTLLESLIAFAILTSVITAAYVTLAQMLGRGARLAEDLDLARAARLALTEYVVTHPEMSQIGTIANRYAYRITETPQPAENMQLLGDGVQLLRIRVDLTGLGAPDTLYTLSTSTLRVTR